MRAAALAIRPYGDCGSGLRSSVRVRVLQYGTFSSDFALGLGTKNARAQTRANPVSDSEQGNQAVAGNLQLQRLIDAVVEYAIYMIGLDGRVLTWNTGAARLKGYSPDGATIKVVRTIPTVNGFVTEFVGEHEENGEKMTDRKILLCEVRSRRVAELTVYCSGDWDAELRARHAAEAPLIRP